MKRMWGEDFCSVSLWKVQGLSRIHVACVRGSRTFFADMLASASCLAFASWSDQDSAWTVQLCVHMDLESKHNKVLPAVEAAVYLEGRKRPVMEEKKWSSGSVTLESLMASDSKPYYTLGLLYIKHSHKTFLAFILDFCLRICPLEWLPSFARSPICSFILWVFMKHLTPCLSPASEPAAIRGAHLPSVYGLDTSSHIVMRYHESIVFLNAHRKRAHMQQTDFLNSLQKSLVGCWQAMEFPMCIPGGI